VALALFFYSGIALGVVFASLGGARRGHLIPVRPALTVTRSEIETFLVLGAAIAIAMWALRNVLFAVVTDEDSRVAGLPVGAMNGSSRCSPPWRSSRAMRVVGILLVAALMVLPVASAQLLARSFRATLLLLHRRRRRLSRRGARRRLHLRHRAERAMVLTAAAVFAVVSIGKRAAPRTLRQEEHA
jgi:zinc transport system permease protein